jgi:hypothetical protein
MPYTTEELIHILDEELRAHWKGERILLSSEQRLQDSVVAKALGSERLSKVFAYQDFRDQVHQYQRQHRVSGIVWHQRSFAGETVRSPEIHNQLIAVEGDKDLLISARSTVLNFWHHVTANLDLWIAGYDPQPTTRQAVADIIARTEWAEIETARTEVYLSLCWGNPTECHYQWASPTSGCVRVIAAQSQPGSIKV